ncbi:MAG: methyl-accepting chemotaxis protein [Acidobacteriota bacterium]|nr:methyl-accepting chemotaxis protein [Acidobacteriota bacterium]
MVFIKNLILSFVPDSLEGDRLLRGRLLAIFMSLLAVVGALYNGFYFRVGSWVGGSAIVAEIFVLIALLFYLKRTAALETCVHWAAGSFTLMMVAITLSNGGASYSATPWAAVPTLFATLILGSGPGRMWFGISMVFFISTYIAGQLGVVFPNLTSTDPADTFWVGLLDFLHFMGCVLYYAVVTFVFDHINRQAMLEAKNALQKAEEASETAECQTRYLAENVERILLEMRALAEGNLTTSLTIEKEDEIGRLCEGFNQAVSRVRTTIAEVADAVNVTVNSSEQIATAAGTLSSGTERQTNSVAEISHAVSEMVTSISGNAESAAHSSQAARQNGEVAREGGKVVQNTVTKIEEIAEVVNNSARSISNLASSSKEIGDIVGVIQDIAGKTNLLALNATIEAASAGDAGRGFNIIATEVKALAGQTSQATKQISEVIETVQDEIQNVISGMQEGLSRVTEGKELAGRAGQALQEIVTSSEDLIGLVEQIAEACERQSEQSRLFLERIHNVREVTEESAGEIRGIADSTGKLGGLTERLREQLGRFIYETA